jgi:signal transduction histidine kinase
VRAIWSRLEVALAGRVWIILVVAVVIAVSTIVLGEVAANDARERMREAQLQAQTAATERAAARAAVVLTSYADGLVDATKLVQTGRGSADAPIVQGARSGDLARIQEALLDIASRLMYAGKLYFVDARGIIVAGITSGNLGTQEAQVIGLGRDHLFFLDAPGSRLGAAFMPPDEFARVFAGPAVYVSDLYEPFDREGRLMAAGSMTAEAPPGAWRGPRVSIGVRILGTDGRLAGALVADTFQFAVADAIFEIDGRTAEQAYLIDRNGRLIKRRQLLNDTEYFRDLSGSPTVRAVLDGRTIRGEAADPLGEGPRLMTSASVPNVPGVRDADMVTGWHVISAQPLDRVFGDLEAGMAVLRAIRLGLVAALLALAVVLTIAMRRVVRQRYALAEANVSLGRASLEIQAVSRHKSEFLANMSHELRTPLNAIIGFAAVLQNRLAGDLNAKQSEYVADIATSGRHLLDLVNEILDLSKVEAGRMEVEKSEFDLSATVRAAVAFVRERAASHGIEIAADVPADLGTLVADERKVRQVLLNLLSNAVKFTSDGGWIGVSARRGDGEVQVSVRDTGIGIAPEDRAAVFEEFRQVGRASDRAREGTGLGLTLAKRFVELQGGRIWLESEVGKGTTFTIALPVGESTRAAVHV